MSTRDYLPQKALAYGLRELPFDGASRPKDRQVALKYGFTLEACIPCAPTVIAHGCSISNSLLPQVFRAAQMPPCDLPVSLLASKDGSVKVVYLHIRKGRTSEPLRNVDGDYCFFIYRGVGEILTDLGKLTYKAGQYLFIPRLHAYVLRAEEKTLLVGMESYHPLKKPIFSSQSQIPYDDLALGTPQPCGADLPYDASRFGIEDKKGWKLWIKRDECMTPLYYDCSYFTCRGWSGTPYPFVLPTEALNFSVCDHLHTDPTAFMTFATQDGDVGISTFVPRRIHSLPYYHQNGYDECLFLAKPYTPRGTVALEGDLVFHPQGWMHGPQPESFDESALPAEAKEAPYVDELAIMFESRKPLAPTALALALDSKEYWKSWIRKAK